MTKRFGSIRLLNARQAKESGTRVANTVVKERKEMFDIQMKKKILIDVLSIDSDCFAKISQKSKNFLTVRVIKTRPILKL